MAKVQLCNITVMENPCAFSKPFQFEITLECIEELHEDLEWKMIYVGSAESYDYDQCLETVWVGPIPEGKHMFLFEAPAPDVTKIPENDAIGVTVVLLTCSYRGQEFIRVGYFINNEYEDAGLRENPPSPPQFDKVIRNILATQPRVTRLKINWEESSGGDGAVSGLPSTSSTAANQNHTDAMTSYNNNSSASAIGFGGDVSNGNLHDSSMDVGGGGNGGGGGDDETSSLINNNSFLEPSISTVVPSAAAAAAAATTSAAATLALGGAGGTIKNPPSPSPIHNENSNSWAAMECV